jgi:hypothetical protein
MTKPIPDKAEVALEYPDKLYIGTFERSARFDAHLDQTGISLTLERPGDAETRKSIRMHLHYGLLAQILCDLAKTASSIPPDDAAHREALQDAAKELYRSLRSLPASATHSARQQRRDQAHQDEKDISKLTPDEEVLLLHVME